MASFNIIKKNRKYFAAETEKGYKCKIVIDDASKDLEVGTIDLDVEDQSVRSKYGTDLIFKVKSNITEELTKGICTLRAAYNVDLVKRCRELSGKWDAESKAWIFPASIESIVEELESHYTDDLKVCDIVIDESGDCGPVVVGGYPIAKATGRDSGAVLCDDVIMIKGEVRSGGSMKNWTTKVDGTFRITLPKEVRENLISEGYEIEIID